jgi:hypothetical protein
MSDNPFERLRAALQYLLNSEGDGWQLSHYVVVLGLQRMDAGGGVENTVWMTVPHEQPDYVTDGLVTAAEEMRACADTEGD